jgi:hypothetical protein
MEEIIMKIRRPYPNELTHGATVRINSPYDYKKHKSAKAAKRINSVSDVNKYNSRYGAKRRSSSKTTKSPRINSVSDANKVFGMSYEEAINSAAYDAILDAVASGKISLDEGGREFAKLLGQEPDDFHKEQVRVDAVVRQQDRNGYKVEKAV